MPLTWPWPDLRQLVGLRAPAYESPHRLRQLEARALAVQLARVGQGEIPRGSNRGPFVAGLARCEGAPRDIVRGERGYYWCAAAGVGAYEAAGLELGIVVPFPMGWRVRRGARRTIRAIARAGAWVDHPHPGCPFAIWRRGLPGSAHFGLCVRELADGGWETVEGNVGRGEIAIRVRDWRDERPALACRSMFATIAPV